MGSFGSTDAKRIGIFPGTHAVSVVSVIGITPVFRKAGRALRRGTVPLALVTKQASALKHAPTRKVVPFQSHLPGYPTFDVAAIHNVFVDKKRVNMVVSDESLQDDAQLMQVLGTFGSL